MRSLLADNPLLLLFVVVALGRALGLVRIRGAVLGPAGALFVGLAVSGVWDDLTVPAELQALGLALFTYTVGLSAAPTFVAGLRRGGVRLMLAMSALVGVLAGAVALVCEVLGFGPGERAGLFAGVGTNTPALQSALDALDVADPAVGDPVVGYSLAYPFGVVFMIVATAIVLLARPRTEGADAPVGWTVEVTAAGLPPLGLMRTWGGSDLSFGRVVHDGEVDLARHDVVLTPGDLITVFGPGPAVQSFTEAVGQRSGRNVTFDRHRFDHRRMVVSNPALAGTRVGALDLPSQHGVTITRIRRGDLDLVATPTMRLQLGDRVRVVGPRERLVDAAALLGDSERQLADVDLLSLALGLAAGLLLGVAELPLPGAVLSLGVGGGPLVAGLVLGGLNRTGPIVWQLPPSANLLLRQLGIFVFLAAVGIRSGATFVDALGTATGWKLVAAAALASAVFVASAALVVRGVLRLEPTEAAGLLAGLQTQPAVLGFANERTNGDERVAQGYALAFPVVMILKIVAVQLLV